MAIDSNTKLLIQNNGFNAQSKAIYFDGSGDYLTAADSADWDFGTGDFTLETWVRFATDPSGERGLIATDSSNGFEFFVLNNTTVRTFIAGTGINFTVGSMVSGKWYHITLSRSGTSLRAFVNGKQSSTGSVTNSGNINASVTLKVGTRGDLSSPTNGWFKQVRISNSARYTTDFTPSTSLFADDANTKLLVLAEETNGATTFVDSEGTPKTITTNGNCVLQYTSDYRESNFIDTETTVKLITDFGDAKILSQAFNKSAGFFETGSGARRLTIPANPDHNFGTGDFTVEAWCMWVDRTNQTQQGIWEKSSGGANGMKLFKSTTHFIKWNEGGTAIATGVTEIRNNVWYHIAVSRSGTSLKIFVNGIQDASVTNSTDLTFTFDSEIGSLADGGIFYNHNGWIKEVRVSNTARYTATFTPSTTQFTTDSNTKLLLHFDTPATAPLAPCIKFDGTGDYLSVPTSVDWNFGLGDFTMETWVRWNVVPGVTAGGLMSNLTTPGAVGFLFVVQSTLFEIYLNTTGAPTKSVSFAPVINRWYHLAVSRSNGSLNLFIDGQQQGTATANTTNLVGSVTALLVGSWLGTGYLMNGWMKNVRISRSARYTASFTPTQSGFSNDSDTLLLLKGDENNGATTFVDSSSAARTVTTVGDTKISYEEDYRTNVFKDSSVTDDAALTSALRFDGTGDWLTVPDSADWDLTDFTLEAWVRFQTLGAHRCFIDVNDSSVNGLRFSWLSSNELQLQIATTDVVVASFTPVLDHWYHFEATRSGSSVRVFADGVQIGSTGTNSTTPTGTAGVRVGAFIVATSGNMLGWMRNVRISNTARHTAAFTPTAISTDLTTDSNTKLLITGSITGGTGQSKAIRFDGTGDYLSLADSADWDLGTGDFTAEGWVRFNSVAGNSTLFEFGRAGSSTGMQWFIVAGGASWELDINGANITNGSFTFVVNRWYHIAISRSGSTLKTFFDGVQQTSVANSTNITGGTQGLFVGSNTSPANQLNGWVKQFRLSTVARYTAAFTPSETQFVNDANTKLLILAEEAVGVTTFSDSEGTPKTITTNGDCIIQQTPDYRNRVVIDREITPKTITTVADSVIENQVGVESKHAYPVATTKAKVDFLSAFGEGVLFSDGTTDRLELSDSSDFDLSGGTFTLEGWVRTNAIGTAQGLWGQSTDSNNYHYTAIDTDGSLKYFGVSGGSANVSLATAASVMVAYVWYHVAIVENGNTYQIFVNGTDKTSSGGTDTDRQADYTGVFTVAAHRTTYFLNGLMDNFRLSNTNRYSATFNPPTEDFSSGGGSSQGFMAFFFD